MKHSIIVSTKDIAGMNIKERLKERGFVESEEETSGHKVLVNPAGVKLYTTDKDTIYSEGVDTELEGDRVIFATRHSSCSCKKTLSVHVSGNWGKAEAGGRDRKLCAAMPSEMRKAFLYLNERCIEGYEVSMECTHHGPLIEKPCMWIEIGSEESSWQDKKAAGLIADAIIEVINNDTAEGKSVIVLGGGHYNQVANKLILRTEYSVGHICPKHQLELLDKEMLAQAIEKNPGFEMCVLDWKGMGPAKQEVIALLEKERVRYERYQSLVKTDSEKND